MSGITLVVEGANWRRKRGIQIRLKQAAEAAVRAVKLKGDVTILLADDKRLAALNRDFRGKDKPTNVLSFPGHGGLGGDIAIAYGLTQTEAGAGTKSFADHAIHLAVHGVLHLAGYDHERPKDAKLMEPLEVKILKRLGIADPYAAMAQ
jgi:probable rRNA maturation factor